MQRRFVLVLALPFLAIAVLALGNGCRVALPFRGPGFDSDRGAIGIGAEEKVLVVLTEGSVAPDRGKDFDRGFREIRADLEERAGLIGFSMRKELLGSRVWTQSAWRDEGALEEFLRAAPHRQATRDQAIPGSTARFAYVELPAGELPLAWKCAEALLDEQNP